MTSGTRPIPPLPPTLVLEGAAQPFLFEMVYAVRDLMKDAYPELVDSADRVATVVKGEETRFAHTLNLGLGRLEDLLAAGQLLEVHHRSNLGLWRLRGRCLGADGRPEHREIEQDDRASPHGLEL